MKKTVSQFDFIREFEERRPDQFSRRALIELFDYFSEYELNTGEEIEFDMISICCDYTESTLDEVRENYSLSSDKNVAEFLEDNTVVVYSDEYENDDGEIDEETSTVVYLSF
ncbi:MAG: hypothetical protein ACRDBG_06515 [Waterburya sp.]